MDASEAPLREDLAREYETVHNRLFVFQLLLTIGLLIAFQLLGFSAELADGLSRFFGASKWFWVNASYAAITVFGFTAILFPLSYYSGHVLEHHYELSRESFGDWFWDFLKSLLVDLILITVLFSVIYALLRWVPNVWWLWATGFYILFAVVLSALGPVVIMPLFHSFEPLEEGELTDAVRALMKEAGIQVIGVYKWGLEEKTTTANAAFAGLGRSRRIILGDTLLSGYSQDEILAILAHEVGHYKNRDMMRLMVLSAVLALVGFFVADWFMRTVVGYLGFEQISEVGAAPVFIFSMLIFSVIAMPLSNGYSRVREFAADQYAVEKTGLSNELVSSLEKLADQNLSMKEPAPWVEFLLHSHPSIKRRVARIRQLTN